MYIPLSALLSGSDKEKLLKEVSLMVGLKHPNVMSLIGVCIDGEMPHLIMPFMTNGTLLQYVKKERNNLYIKEANNDIEVGSIDFVCMMYIRTLLNRPRDNLSYHF